MIVSFARRAAAMALFLMLSQCGSNDSSLPATGGSAGASQNTGGASPGTGGGISATGGAGGSNMPVLDAASDAPAVGPGDDGGSCQSLVEQHPEEGFTHLNACDPTTYQTNPPSSGNHYSIWADYKTYTTTFRPGFWVHSLEHGAIVITYNCPDGCPDDVAKIQAFIDALPNDCAPSHVRVILLPDPDLDVKFAASAWTFTLKAPCFDPVAFRQFFNDHYDHGREQGVLYCAAGIDPVGVCP